MTLFPSSTITHVVHVQFMSIVTVEQYLSDSDCKLDRLLLLSACLYMPIYYYWPSMRSRGWIFSRVSFCVCLGPQKCKNRLRPITSYLDRTYNNYSLVHKGCISGIWQSMPSRCFVFLLLCLSVLRPGLWQNFIVGTKWATLRGQYRSLLPPRVANHSLGFVSSCLLTELSI